MKITLLISKTILPLSRNVSKSLATLELEINRDIVKWELERWKLEGMKTDERL